MANTIYGNVANLRALSTAISVPTGIVTTTLFTSYSTPSYNEGGGFSTTTGRYTPSIPGWYLINSNINYAYNGIGQATVIVASILLNGTDNWSSYAGNGSTTAVYPVISVSTMLYLNGSTDYVQMGTMHNASSTATNVSANFQAFLIRSGS